MKEEQTIRAKILDLKDQLAKLEKDADKIDGNKYWEEWIRTYQEIYILEWSLKTKEEKQSYRKMIVNGAKKSGSMEGTVPQTGKKLLESLTEIYDLSNEIIEHDFTPERIKKILLELKDEIDVKMILD